MLASDDGLFGIDLGDLAERLADVGIATSLGAGEFRLDGPALESLYAQLYAAYEAIRETYDAVARQGEQCGTPMRCTMIAGVDRSLGEIGRYVQDPFTMFPASVLALEGRIARLLQAIHDSAAASATVDDESAASLRRSVLSS